jgi:ABC-type cobalamin/Fe3+-siderophores transport system ATPase subunit
VNGYLADNAVESTSASNYWQSELQIIAHGTRPGTHYRYADDGACMRSPSCLIGDEVTTGLDASQAFNVMQSLSALASNGLTVAAVIHQPRMEIFSMFDDVMASV